MAWCLLDTQLRDHLSDLAVAARASGLRCDLLRGTIAQAGEAAALREIQGFTRSEKESLRLLRLARDRIAADAHSECRQGLPRLLIFRSVQQFVSLS